MDGVCMKYHMTIENFIADVLMCGSVLIMWGAIHTVMSWAATVTLYCWFN